MLLLHGTGGTEHDLIPLAQKLAPGAALLSPRGNVREGKAARFFARLAEGVFDAKEVAQRTGELADFIEAAAQHYKLDLSRLVAVGLSNGANIAAPTFLRRPKVLAGAMFFRPMVVLEQPAAPGSLAGKRILIANGAFDPIVPADHPARLATNFKAAGAEVELVMQQASHGLIPADLRAATDWLRQSK